MPPKVRITKEKIVDAAIEIIRTSGAQAVNARTIASWLNCSTQPIFFNFATMEELQKEVEIAAYGRYLEFLQREAENGEYPKYKAFGMAYIRFAKEEKELFKLLFMCERNGNVPRESVDFEASVAMIQKANQISREEAERMHLEMWVCVHGIATMLATSYLTLQWELISNMLTDVYQGLRTGALSREGKK